MSYIYIAADHRGFSLKEKLGAYLKERGYEVEDLGALEHNKEDDYPDFAKLVSEKVALNPGSRGILICGSGIGIAIAANKHKGIRAGTVMKPEQARAAVNDEDLNVLALSADYSTEEEAKEIVKAFLGTKFSGAERHKRRLQKIEK
jgi:ribose 5-phosphate isomerase B